MNWRFLLLTILINSAVAAGVVTLSGQSIAPNSPGEVKLPNPVLDPIIDRRAVSEEEAIVEIVERVEPAVVSVIVKKAVPILEQYYERFSPFPDFFGPFEFNIPRFRERGREEREVGGGSGFLISPDGFLVTNRHVVEDREAAYVVLTNDNKKHDAQVIARDPFFDIAVLKIQGRNFPYLRFGDSDKLKLGQTAIAIGNALGEFRNSVSVGVISGLSRRVVAGDRFGRSELLEEVIQTDAAINPGNSGGPLLNLRGEVVGVNVAMALGSENIGFALPANLVKGVVDSIREHGEIVRPFLGIRYVAINKALQERNNLPFDYGVLVIRGESAEELAVIPGSPADKAGIVENDIILAFDGQQLDAEHSLASLIRKKKVGDQVTLRIWSKGQERTVKVVLERFREPK